MKALNASPAAADIPAMLSGFVAARSCELTLSSQRATRKAILRRHDVCQVLLEIQVRLEGQLARVGLNGQEVTTQLPCGVFPA
jgi:hypothetical protein